MSESTNKNEIFKTVQQYVRDVPLLLFGTDGIETNFYGGGGSKLNETARSYKQLAQEADTVDGFTFVWFTDGIGWVSARNNLEETFDVMEHVYSINDLENGVLFTRINEVQC